MSLIIIFFIKKDRMTDIVIYGKQSDTVVSEDGMKFGVQGNSVL